MLRVLRGTRYGKGEGWRWRGIRDREDDLGGWKVYYNWESSLRLHAYISVFWVSRETGDVQ